jgi:hypothetical protein
VDSASSKKRADVAFALVRAVDGMPGGIEPS